MLSVLSGFSIFGSREVLGARGEVGCEEECQGGALRGDTFKCLQLMDLGCACMRDCASNGLCGLVYAGRVHCLYVCVGHVCIFVCGYVSASV